MKLPLSRVHTASRFDPPTKAAFAGGLPLAERPSALALVSVKTGPAAQRLTGASKGERRRARIWELGASLHCSIIGTCLTTGELRAVLRKFGAVREAASEHDLHHIAVSAVAERGPLAKQIQKALDRRHHATINRFGKAATAGELRRCWDEAMQAGEIPGAYWTALTHAAADDDLVRHVFGAVHMLSHLVGSANRADIRRLHQLESEKAALEEKLARQQAQLRDAILTRDTRIRELGTALSHEIKRQMGVQSADAHAHRSATLDALVADLRKQLDAELRRRDRAERRAEAIALARAKHESTRLAMEQELGVLRDELEAAEARLAALATTDGETPGDLDLAGITILYVGGRPHQVARLRLLVEQSSGTLIHHDGGIEERKDLLPGLVSRADAAFFPVDCVSHDAALSLKRLCRLAGKPYVPLRSSGAASLLHALQSSALDVGALRRPA